MILKKIAFTMTVTWPWVLHGLETKIARFHCALFAVNKLTNTAMAPAKLNRHFTTNDGHLSNKTIDYFKRLSDSQGKQRNLFEKKVTISEKAQETSYLVGKPVAKKMKTHTIAESLIMPACKIIVTTMIGK
jgi:hypothetical protein